VQGRHYGIGQLPQLAGRQLCAPGDILGVEGEQVVGGDEGLVERGQQVREGPRLKVRQHLEQVRHGLRRPWTGRRWSCGRLCGLRLLTAAVFARPDSRGASGKSRRCSFRFPGRGSSSSSPTLSSQDCPDSALTLRYAAASQRIPVAPDNPVTTFASHCPREP
jgi:hypothetical protein